MGLSIGLSSAGNPAYRSLQVFIQPVFLSWASKLMRGAQWRGAVEQGRHRLPGQLLVGETIGFAGHAKALQWLQWHAHQLPGKAVGGVALVGVDVDAREALALKGIADYRTVLVECGAGAVDRSWSFGSQACPS